MSKTICAVLAVKKICLSHEVCAKCPIAKPSKRPHTYPRECSFRLMNEEIMCLRDIKLLDKFRPYHNFKLLLGRAVKSKKYFPEEINNACWTRLIALADTCISNTERTTGCDTCPAVFPTPGKLDSQCPLNLKYDLPRNLPNLETLDEYMEKIFTLKQTQTQVPTPAPIPIPIPTQTPIRKLILTKIAKFI